MAENVGMPDIRDVIGKLSEMGLKTISFKIGSFTDINKYAPAGKVIYTIIV